MKLSDEQTRQLILSGWKQLCLAGNPGLLSAHCGGQGLVVGCPVCGKRWGT